MNDLNAGPVVELVSTVPNTEDREIFEQMIERLENAGLCAYRFHALGAKVFGIVSYDQMEGF